MRAAPLRAASLAACASVLAAAPAAAQHLVLYEGEDFLNTTFVGDEAEAARLALYRAEEQLGARQPKEAGREIVKLLRGEARGLVRYGERLVVPVETAALFVLLRLPEPIRAELAREEAAAGGATPPAGLDDSDALRAFALRHPLAAAGEGALLEAGVRELLAGEPGSAAADLERLVHWPTAWPGATRNVAAARLLEAQARSGGFVNGAISHWPRGADATIARGGAVTRLDELLAAARPLPEPREDLSEAPAFAAAWPQPPLETSGVVRYADHRWRFSLNNDGQPGESGAARRDLPTRAPVVLPGPDGDRLAMVEADGLHVRRIAGGEEAFAPLRFDFDLHLDPRVALPVLDRSGLARFGDRLYLTLELLASRRFDARFGVESASTALFAFDLKRECYVEFAVTSAELLRDPALAGYVFAGPPVESGGRILVSASRLVGKETEVALLAFDAKSGAPAGHVLLARAANVPEYSDRLSNDNFWRVEPSPVVVRDGVAFVCTNVGLMAAVRTADLGLVWGYRYHRRDSPVSEKFSRSCLYANGGWIGRPPVVLADRVVATPSDSNYAYVFARWPDARGDLVLNEPIQRDSRVVLVGATADSLYFVQRVGDPGAPRWFVEATDHEGVPRWTSVKLPVGERIAGVPVLTRRHLFVATDHVVYPIVLAREGSFYDRPIGLPERLGQPPPDVAGFGDLAVSGRYLVSTSALFTLVFESAKE